MTKGELIEKLAKASGITLGTARRVVDALFSNHPTKGIITSSLRKRERVNLPGFGFFYSRSRTARKALNPRTGRTVQVNKRRYPAFKPSRALKNVLQ